MRKQIITAGLVGILSTGIVYSSYAKDICNSFERNNNNNTVCINNIGNNNLEEIEVANKLKFNKINKYISSIDLETNCGSNFKTCINKSKIGFNVSDLKVDYQYKLETKEDVINLNLDLKKYSYCNELQIYSTKDLVRTNLKCKKYEFEISKQIDLENLTLKYSKDRSTTFQLELIKSNEEQDKYKIELEAGFRF